MPTEEDIAWFNPEPFPQNNLQMKASIAVIAPKIPINLTAEMKSGFEAITEDKLDRECMFVPFKRETAAGLPAAEYIIER